MNRNFQLRDIKPEDINVIYELSNDPFVRANSIHKETIKREDHEKWFNKKLNDPYCFFKLAFSNNGEFIGQVRIETENSFGVINISVAKNFRGKGFAASLIEEASREYFIKYKTPTRIKAYIKPENISSARSFEKAGFLFLGHEAILDNSYMLFEYKKNELDVLNLDKTFIIAELSANHNHKFDVAVETIKAAKKAGADAIKLQTYTPDTITIDCDNEYFQIKQGTIWDGETLYSLYKKAYTPWEWQPKLKKIAEEEGLVCFSSPFDKTSVDFLEEMNVPAYKIASFEITDIPLIEYVAVKHKPVIISTGIAALADIEEALSACRRMGNNQIVLLKCTSNYPAPIEEANLLTIPNMRETFKTEVGLSDHTMGASVAIAAVALGAKVIEKHFILDRNIGGPDASFSMEPEEFKQMTTQIREVEKALGSVSYELTEKTVRSREYSRSLFFVKDIKAGEKITSENIRSIRPGFGLHPKYYNEVIGKRALRDIKAGNPVSWSLIED